MNAFLVDLTNKPGELARLTDAIAQKGINITGFAGAATGSTGTAVLVTNDEAATRSAIASTGAKVREIELVTVGLQNHPGTLAEIVRKIADAGINIEAAMPVGMAGDEVHVAFATSDPARTRQILGERVMTGTMA